MRQSDRSPSRLLAAGAVAWMWAAAAAAQETELISIGPDGFEAADQPSSTGTSTSRDGRFVAFDSRGTNLVEGLGNFTTQVFVRDRQQRRTRMATVGPEGDPGDEFSILQEITPDGRHVIIDSLAVNLTEVDPEIPDARESHVFVRDLVGNRTQRVDVVGMGDQAVLANAPSGDGTISADGRFAAFVTRATNLVPGDMRALEAIYVRDLVEQRTTRVFSHAPGMVTGLSDLDFSDDGRFLVFTNRADDDYDDNNRVSDIYLLDRASGEVEVMSTDINNELGNAASQGPRISGDGRLVFFESLATNLVDADTNRVQDVFLRDRLGGTTRISLAPGGVQSDRPSDLGAISHDGRFVLYTIRRATAPASDVMLRDRALPPATGIVIPGLASDGRPLTDAQAFSLSGDGRVIAFNSSDEMVVPCLDPPFTPQTYARILAGPTNRPPVAMCQGMGQPLVIPTDPGMGTATLRIDQVDAGSSDPDGDAIDRRLVHEDDDDTETGLPIGDTGVTLLVTDRALTSCCTVTVRVEDREPPRVACEAMPMALVAPVRRRLFGLPIPLPGVLVDVTVRATVADNDVVQEAGAQVFSNEPVAAGPIPTTPDAVVIGTPVFGLGLRLRAENLGRGLGRVYLVLITARDPAGNTATGRCAVAVPRRFGFQVFDRILGPILAQMLIQGALDGSIPVPFDATVP